MNSPKGIPSVLEDFHKDKADLILAKFSDIAGNQFEGEFNVSGFHKEILDLPNKATSLWGIDRCLRVQDLPDSIHSFLFHMGIFAKSMDLVGDYVDPFKDNRFHTLQKEILSQFLELLGIFNIDLGEVEISYLEQITFGGNTEGRDKLLKRKYNFPTDEISKSFLANKVRLIPVKSLENVDINPVKGAFVGPRLEIAYQGIEIGTVVFNCFKIGNGVLVPINYVAGYALGVERLVAALGDKHFFTSIPRYEQARKILANISTTATSSLFEKEAMVVIYGAEVLAHLTKNLSRHQNERARILRKAVKENVAALGINESVIDELVLHFGNESIL